MHAYKVEFSILSFYIGTGVHLYFASSIIVHDSASKIMLQAGFQHPSTWASKISMHCLCALL